MDSAHITVNGAPVPLTGVPTHTNTLDFLRGLGLTGAKEGCAEGECGACAVLVARPAADGSEATEWTAVNSCLVPVAALDGQEVVTAEGLGTPTALHPVQRELAVRGGSQCGYCTPGFVCAMAAEFYRADRSPDRAGRHGPAGAAQAAHERGPNGFDLHALSGNLCRCTGYRPIMEAAYALGPPAADDTLAARRTAPPAAPPATRLQHQDTTFVRPASLAQALSLLTDHPDATVVAGATDWGVEVTLRAARPTFSIAIDRLPELRELVVGDAEIRIGAALTLTEIERRLDGRVPLIDLLLPQFASRLIRNLATLGGNLGTASPIGDAAPVLLALDARLVLVGPAGARTVDLADYFTGYRATVRRTDELITEVVVPLPLAPLTAFHKIAKRRFDDISSVAVAFALDVTDGVVRQARIGLGGVAATPIRARATEDALTGRPWTSRTVRAAADVLAGEGTPIDDQRASAAYRSAMLGQALGKLGEQTGATGGPRTAGGRAR